MKRTLFHSITILILSSLLKQQLLTTNQQKAIRQSKQGSPEDTCVSSEVHRVVAVLHNSNSRAKKQLHLENYILKNKEIKILNLWKVCEMCAGKKICLELFYSTWAPNFVLWIWAIYHIQLRGLQMVKFVFWKDDKPLQSAYDANFTLL